jgi:hypothetical protein
MLIALLAAMVVLVTPQAAPAPQAPAATAGSIRATIRMTIAKVDAPIASDAKPSPYGNFGPLIAQLLTPEGPVDIQYVITGDQSRAEVRGRLATLPRGSIVLQRVGEDSIRVLNPENKTWYEIPANQNLGVLLGTPDVDIQPVGETATIAGQRAQRFRFTETLRVPVAEGVSLPPDFPRDIQLTGDLWSTDAFAGGGYHGDQNGDQNDEQNLCGEVVALLENESVTEEAKALLRAALASGDNRKIKLLLKPLSAIPPLGEDVADA